MVSGVVVKVKKEYVDYVALGVFVIFAVGMITGSLSYTLVVIDNPDPNSMWPTYFQGDLFLIHKTSPQDIHLGDVIVYQENSRSVKVIHRVVDIIIDKGDYYYRVKGDNYITNQGPDKPGVTTNSPSLIPYSKVVGKTMIRIPYIGHLTLAMQRNSGVQIMVYFIAILAIIAVFAWPSDEEEKKDEMLEISLAIIVAWLKSIIFAPKNIFLRIKNSKHRILTIFAILTLFAILLIPAFIGASINTRGNYNSIGVLSVTPSAYSVLNDTIGTTDYSSVFIQLQVELVDNAGMMKSIKQFEVEVFTDAQLQNRISDTKWISFKDFTGRVIIGASIVIPHELIPAKGTTLHVHIMYQITSYFFFHSYKPFDSSFQYNY